MPPRTVQARRAFLAGLLATGLAPRPSWADVGNPAFISAARRADGSFALYGLSETGEMRFEAPLSARGHAAAVHPTRPEAVAFARRPGTFALVVDCASGAVLARLSAPEGRHFYGHGAFSLEGDLLFTTENDFDNARGMVGVWDARNRYRRLTEFSSGGTGPHDIKVLPGGTLAVANGGIETHPETGRLKLNIPTMRPNLSYLTADGEARACMELAPELHKASIRHLAVDRAGRVAMGMQWQGDITDEIPLAALDDRRAGTTRLSDGREQRGLNGYVGSIEIVGEHVALTSPRGGIVQLCDTGSMEVRAEIARRDVCGIAAHRDALIVTTGEGGFEDLSSGLRRDLSVAWDNHLVRVA